MVDLVIWSFILEHWSIWGVFVPSNCNWNISFLLSLQDRKVNGKSIIFVINNPLNMMDLRHRLQWLFKSFHIWEPKLYSEARRHILHRHRKTHSKLTQLFINTDCIELQSEGWDEVRGEDGFHAVRNMCGCVCWWN